VDHTVPYNIDFGGAGNRLRLTAPQSLEQARDGFTARIGRRQILYGNSVGILDRKLGPAVDPFDLTLPSTIRWIFGQRIVDFVETALLAAGTGVENKHFHQ
jgi:hypothetical protein